jgi:hypothetical protein
MRLSRCRCKQSVLIGMRQFTFRAPPHSRQLTLVTLRGRSTVIALHYAGQTKARAYVRQMKKSDIICPSCNAGYRRVELASGGRTTGEFRCLLCDHVLEVFDGTAEVAIRLTVQPEKTFQGITEIIKH